jgi:histidinol-phosphatase (PHP family)
MERSMIDSHCHTFYSKHAIGTIDDLVRASITAGVSVLTITDHAPFPIDQNNRLLESELDQYFSDIESARDQYGDLIKILRGLEIDYMPGSESYNRELLNRYPIDFVIGSVHYVEVPNQHLVKVWELPRLADDQFLNQYFVTLQELLASGLVDAIGHPDVLLRGVSEDSLLPRFKPFIEALAKSGIAFELNSSGLRKSSLGLKTGTEVDGLWTYPSRRLLMQMIALDIPFTIGSDAHSPGDVGAGIKYMLESLQTHGLRRISYYEERRRVDVDLGN